jgi:hypothetical protein
VNRGAPESLQGGRLGRRATSRALWGLKTAGHYRHVFRFPPRFPPIASRSICSTPYSIWRLKASAAPYSPVKPAICFRKVASRRRGAPPAPAGLLQAPGCVRPAGLPQPPPAHRLARQSASTRLSPAPPRSPAASWLPGAGRVCAKGWQGPVLLLRHAAA